jgi:DNA ligase (NAD+)
VDDIDPVIATSVCQFFSSNFGQQVLAELTSLGLDMGKPVEQSAQASEDSPLFGKSVVVTGTLVRMTREEANELIRTHGGKSASSVSRKTNFLVAGDNACSKLTKAQSLGVAILTEDEFLKLLETET